MNWPRQLLRDYREGARILASREFWQDFRSYWGPEAIAQRLDNFTARLSDYTGKPYTRRHPKD